MYIQIGRTQELRTMSHPQEQPTTAIKTKDFLLKLSLVIAFLHLPPSAAMERQNGICVHLTINWWRISQNASIEKRTNGTTQPFIINFYSFGSVSAKGSNPMNTGSVINYKILKIVVITDFWVLFFQRFIPGGNGRTLHTGCVFVCVWNNSYIRSYVSRWLSCRPFLFSLSFFWYFPFRTTE